MSTLAKMDYCNIAVVFDSRGDATRHTAMRQWLFENIDPECYDAEDFSTLKLNSYKRNIWFSNEHDAMWFKLRWS